MSGPTPPRSQPETQSGAQPSTPLTGQSTGRPTNQPATQRWEVTPFYGVLVVSLLGFLLPSDELPGQVDVWDKLSHAAIFVVLALTGRFAGFAPRRLLVGLLGYAVLTEVLQGVLPIGRDGDWHDVLADLVGALVGLVVTAALTRLLRPRT